MKFVVFILTIGSVRRNFPSGLLYNFVYIYIFRKKKVLLSSSYNFQLIQLIKEMCLKSFIVTISCPTNQHDSTNKKTKSYFPHETSMGFTTFRHLLGDVLGMRLPEVINLAARKMTIYSLIVLPNFH